MIYPAESGTSYRGYLRINTSSFDTSGAVPGAKVSISYSGEPDNVIEEIDTDENGNSIDIPLPAPKLEYSMEPGVNQPYSEYNITVSARGYETVRISGIEILPDELSIQNVSLLPKAIDNTAELFVIGPHTLYGDYPPKEPESEIKPVNESGEIVLSRVVIPEYVVVHDGPPADANAKNYYVRYTDYIKNVASSEIYATWPEAAITANVLAIQSFTLNRVFTEWYRNKNYDFTITSSTAVDHKWIPERNIFQSISDVVDNIFNNYLSRPDVLQPILTQYCDGKRVTCPGVMSQWGSKYLADDGFSAIEILKNFYGSSLYINETDIISGIPSSWPGYDLAIGSSGEKVFQLQNELNVIATAYPGIPLLAVDGIYGQGTAESVRAFQKIFNIGETGIVDFQTWYKISQIYVGVSRIAEYN